jgi:hypothetical protein
MAAALVDLLVCAGHADERRGGATHEGHQTASALVVVLVGDVPTALMIAWVARAANALSVSSAVIVASAGTTTTSTAGRSRGCIVTGTVRPAPVVTLRPVPVTSTRIGGIDGPAPGALGLRRREDADERGQPGADAPVTGERPGMRDANGSKAVVCATGPAGLAARRVLVAAGPGWPHAVAAPRGWQACGGVPRRQAAWHRCPRRRAGCATATRTGTGHADPRGGQILRAGFAVAARQPPGRAGDLADRHRAGPPPLRLGAVVLTSMRSRPSPAACRTTPPAMPPAPGCPRRSAGGRRA